jgi:hypothetical protein
MIAEWPLWRLVKNNMATWSELSTHWSMDDVAKANAILDMTDTIEAVHAQEIKAKQKGR